LQVSVLVLLYRSEKTTIFRQKIKNPDKKFQKTNSKTPNFSNNPQIFRQKTLTHKQLIALVLLIHLFTFIEAVPFMFNMKQGPSNETIEESQALFEFVGWDKFDQVPPFTVISTVQHKNLKYF
jgi:hypothetical protein